MANLSALGYEIRYIADIGRFDAREMRRRIGSGPVLFHGGGNFGDLWPIFQDERDRLILQLQSHPIVVLPQTIYFQDESRASRTRDAFRQHGRVTLLVREHQSLSSAHRLFPEVNTLFCDDGAFGNDPIDAPQATRAVTVLRRRDQEGTNALAEIAGEVGDVDWRLSPRRQVLWMANRIPGALFRRSPGPVRRVLQPWVDGTWQRFAALNLESAISLVGSGRVLVTDRLHAHVLAILMGRKSIVMDNNYGKIRPIYEASIAGFSNSEFVTDASRLKERARAAEA